MGNEMNELRYLKNTLCEKIYEGIYKDGKKIPSERQLSTDYEVSRITVRKTLELMEKENLIVREVGNGTRVTLKNYGNANPLDLIRFQLFFRLQESLFAVKAVDYHIISFFCKFYCRISKAGMGKKYTITICRGTGKSNAGRLSVPSVYEKYQKRGSMAG